MGIRFKVGTVEGTGAAINVELGFTPSYVKCINIDDAGALAPSMEWISGMGAGGGLLGLGITDSGATGNEAFAIVATGGITVYDGVAGSNAKGFTIGADANLNASGETILYVAFGDE